ncbi:hypothetical protein PHYSODRAFT_295889 [Phytophthora sojae]|uniref:Uncharacterized protein n=1 Tax=Phytophthora sojae (strain P6497) TaxID=1094619 RepID=G4YTE5_PHYSP|nr:hypothetical protein PHYSODRAFT_295889 [Phytophthora sojae]EGZ23544.1 hypothetical protein PHYSODRAFT_295889 [Phytophthora sojae]|eukprot:XP_009518832.1 hypothetical protein PHYSODRAFT_295889 [Phytophthora sojae]
MKTWICRRTVPSESTNFKAHAAPNVNTYEGSLHKCTNSPPEVTNFLISVNVQAACVAAPHAQATVRTQAAHASTSRRTSSSRPCRRRTGRRSPSCQSPAAAHAQAAPKPKQLSASKQLTPPAVDAQAARAQAVAASSSRSSTPADAAGAAKTEAARAQAATRAQEAHPPAVAGAVVFGPLPSCCSGGGRSMRTMVIPAQQQYEVCASAYTV